MASVSLIQCIQALQRLKVENHSCDLVDLNLLFNSKQSVQSFQILN